MERVICLSAFDIVGGCESCPSVWIRRRVGGESFDARSHIQISLALERANGEAPERIRSGGTLGCMLV